MLAPSLKIPTNPRSINLDSFVLESNEIKFIDVIELIYNNVSKDEIIKLIRSRKKRSERRFVKMAPDPFKKLGTAGVDILA